MVDRASFPQYLRRSQASQYLSEVWGLQYAASTLAKMCSLGSGPETYKWGKVAMHTPEDLDNFARSRIRPAPRKRSESQQHEAAAV